MNTFKITEIKDELAIVELKLITNGEKTTFRIITNGLAFRVASDHSINELELLLEFLRMPSKNDDNLRDMQSEIMIFSKNAIKAHEKFNSIQTL